MTCWHVDMLTCWHDDMLTCWHADMMTFWHDDMMTWWHADMMTCWHDNKLTWCQEFRITWFWAPKFETTTYSLTRSLTRVKSRDASASKKQWAVWVLFLYAPPTSHSPPANRKPKPLASSFDLLVRHWYSISILLAEVLMAGLQYLSFTGNT